MPGHDFVGRFVARSLTGGLDLESSSSSSSEEPPAIKIEYTGSSSDTNANLEEIKTFITDPQPGEEQGYYLRGYMLRITAPEILAGSDVIWTIQTGGVDEGTYHESIDWLKYPISITKPKSRTICWRSSTGNDSLGGNYSIKADYTDPNGDAQTISVSISTRAINANDTALKTKYQSDVDMLQRMMIQILYLNKGRLTSWQSGLYLDNNQGSAPFYISVSRTGKWSKVADEVRNFRIFAQSEGSGASRDLTAVALGGMWAQFDKIIVLDFPNAVNITTAAFPGWVAAASTTSGLGTAISGLDDTSGNQVTDVNFVTAQTKRETTTGRHAVARSGAIKTISTFMAEANAGSGSTLHTYSEAGLGFLQVQPYNATQGGVNYNLYDPGDNLKAALIFLTSQINAGGNPGTNTKTQVWYGLAAYNRGPGVFLKYPPSSLRAADKPLRDGAEYADAVFNFMSVTPP